MCDSIRVLRDQIVLILLVGAGRTLHFLNDRSLEIVRLGFPKAQQLVKFSLLFLCDG